MGHCRTAGYPYALKAEQLVHISQVSRGIACGCQCPRCRNPMLARKGESRRHHFAHLAQTTCDGAPETILHWLAKELFVCIQVLHLPEYRVHLRRTVENLYGVERTVLVVPARRVQVDHVVLEPRIDQVVPDIVICSRDRKLFIEIAVTHPVERRKLRWLRRADQPAIEIRLTPEDAWLSREELHAKLARDLHCKRWIFHPKQREVEREFFAALRTAAQTARRDRRQREQFQKQVLASARRTAARPRTASVRKNDRDWIEAERFAREFHRKHGRWPALEDTLQFFRRSSRNSS